MLSGFVALSVSLTLKASLLQPIKGVDRFAQSRRIKQYQERYLNHDQMFEALDCITAAAEAAGITVLEAAVRWTQHHSGAARPATPRPSSS